MKTTEKPKMNSSDFKKMVLLSVFPISACLRSSTYERPEITEIYEGTSGRTHGEKNEISPAASATGNESPAATSMHQLLYPSRDKSRIIRTSDQTTSIETIARARQAAPGRGRGYSAWLGIFVPRFFLIVAVTTYREQRLEFNKNMPSQHTVASCAEY